MAEQRIQELEDRKRPLRERLRGPDPQLDREISLRDRLHGDVTDLRSRQRARDDRFAARKRSLADHDGDRQTLTNRRTARRPCAQRCRRRNDRNAGVPQGTDRRLPASETQRPLDRRNNGGRDRPPPPRHHRCWLGVRYGPAGRRTTHMAASSRCRRRRPRTTTSKPRTDGCAESASITTNQPGSTVANNIFPVHSVVRVTGIEPARLSTPGPKPGASANFATPASVAP
jgi:hypothetical protein